MSEVKKATKAAYPWRTDERALMDTRMVEFSDPNLSKDARHILLREILTEMKELYDPPLSLLEWKLKKIEVKLRMRSKGRQIRTKEQSSLSPAWSARRVVCHLKKADIEAIAITLSGARPGERAYMKQYQNAVNAVMGKLSKQELSEFTDTAKAWTEQGSTPETQAHNWATKGLKFFQTVVKTGFRDFGVRLLICSIVKDQDGERMMHFHDENGGPNAPGANSMKKELPGAFSKLQAAWSEYTMYTTGLDDDDDRDPTVRTTGAPKPRLVLKVDSKKMPILPPWNKIRDGPEAFSSQKEIIRAFVIEHYKLASNRERVRVPWGSIQAKQEDFLEPDSICESAVVVDPSRIKHGNATRILTHWRTFGFKFRSYSDNGTLHNALYKNLEKSQGKRSKKIAYEDDLEDTDGEEPRPRKSNRKQPNRQTDRSGPSSDTSEEPPKKHPRVAPDPRIKGKGRAISAPESEVPDGVEEASPLEAEASEVPLKRKRQGHIGDNPAPKKAKTAIGKEQPEVLPKVARPLREKINPSPVEQHVTQQGQAPKGKSSAKMPATSSQVPPAVPKKATANKSKSLKTLPPTPPPKTVKFATGPAEYTTDTDEEDFESISNPHPKPPPARAETRSMTGASPVKATATGVPRPRPKPVGKSDGKVAAKSLEESMKETSKRTLKSVKAKVPAKPRRK